MAAALSLKQHTQALRIYEYLQADYVKKEIFSNGDKYVF